MKGTLIKTVGKVGIAVGAVAVTASQGVWSADTETGARALNKVRSRVLPAANEMYQKIPSTENVTNMCADKWNTGVKTVFSVISTAPEKSTKYVTAKIKELQK